MIEQRCRWLNCFFFVFFRASTVGRVQRARPAVTPSTRPWIYLQVQAEQVGVHLAIVRNCARDGTTGCLLLCLVADELLHATAALSILRTGDGFSVVGPISQVSMKARRYFFGNQVRFCVT